MSQSLVLHINMLAVHGTDIIWHMPSVSEAVCYVSRSFLSDIQNSNIPIV